MERVKKKLWSSVGVLAGFVLWTMAVRFVDVRAIGPKGSTVGLAAINQWMHDLTGVHFALYTITDWLGLVPIGVCMGFGVLGLVQWIRRKSIWKVDARLLVLGCFYLLVMAVYALFEVVVVNYRPVLIQGYLEASYPSSTTMLVLCAMPTAGMELRDYLKRHVLRCGVTWGISVFTVFMVIGRLISGVHWLTDIVGGALLSAGLVMLYNAGKDIVERIMERKRKDESSHRPFRP